MGQTTDEITRQIEETRAELGSNLQELEWKIKGAADWRAQFRKRPFTLMGLALAGGLLLGMTLGGRAS